MDSDNNSQQSRPQTNQSKPQTGYNRPQTNQTNNQQQQQSQYQDVSQNNSQMIKTGNSFKPIEINQPCAYPDHEDAIMGICMKPNCEKKSRLVCFTCAISTHHDHGQYIVRLSDMAKSDDLFIRNWPNSKQAIEINEFLKLNQPELTVSYVESEFEKFKKNIVLQLDKCKQKVIEDVNKRLEKNKKILKDVYSKLDDTYNLKNTKVQIQELNENKIDADQFNKNIQNFLTGQKVQANQYELDQIFLEKKKKIHDQFNQELLHHFYDKLLKIIEDLPQLLWPKNASVRIDNKGNRGGVTSGLETKVYKKI